MSHTERINGIKTNFDRVTDEELVSMLEFAAERALKAKADVDSLLVEANNRHIITLECATDYESGTDEGVEYASNPTKA